VEGNDKNNVDSALRPVPEFYFKDPEGNLMLEYTFFDLEKKKISRMYSEDRCFPLHPFANDSLAIKFI